MQYRTHDQLESIFENVVNGNRTDAGKQCAKYWVYAKDLVEHFENVNDYTVEITDLVYLAEIASKHR